MPDNSKIILFFKSALGIYTALSLASVIHLIAPIFFIPFSYQVKLWLSLAYGYWITITFILVQIGLGRLLLRLPLLREIDLSKVPHLIFSFGTGFYITYFLLMILAHLNWLKNPIIYLFFFAAVPSAFSGLKTLNKFDHSPSREKRKTSYKIGFKICIPIVVIIFIIIWFTPFFIQTLLPNTDWDGASFHLPQAKRFLEGKINQIEPSFYFYNFPSAINLVYSLFLSLNAEAAIIPFNFLSAIIIILVVYVFTKQLWNRKAAVWAAAMCIGVNLLWEVSITPRIDVFLTLFILLACYAILLWISKKEKNGLLILTGMMLGIAIGIKYTAAFFVIVLVPIIMLLSFKRNPNKYKQTIMLLLLCTLAIAIPSSWWYARNLIHLGDPIYPYISGKLFYDSNKELKDLNSSIKELLQTMPPEEEIETTIAQLYGSKSPFSDITKPKKPHNLFNLWDILKNPDKHQRNPYHEINVFILLFFFLPFFTRRKEVMWLYGIGLAFYIIIAPQTYLVRYALPVFPLFSIGAGVIVSNLRSKILTFTIGLGICLTLVYFNYFEWGKISYLQPKTYLIEKTSRIKWLENTGYNLRLKDTPQFIHFVNKAVENGSIKKDDSLLMIGECKGNLLKCKYLPDPGRGPVLWLEELIKSKNDYEDLAQNLHNKGIQYLAVNTSYFEAVSTILPIEQEPILFGLFHLTHFLEKHTDIIYNKEGIILAKIKPIKKY